MIRHSDVPEHPGAATASALSACLGDGQGHRPNGEREADINPHDDRQCRVGDHPANRI